MLKTMAALREVGQGYDVIVPQLQHFWRPGETPPADSRSLRRLMETVRERGEPKWFATWKPAAQPPVSGAAYAPPDVAPDEDDAELLKMFEQDNERLQGELRAERDMVVQIRKELADALDAFKLWKGEYDKLHERYSKLKDEQVAKTDTDSALEAELRAKVAAAEREYGELLGKLDHANRAYSNLNTKWAKTEQELQILQVDKQSASDNLEIARRRIREMESQAQPSAATNMNGLGTMLTHVRACVPAILSAEEALDKLATYAAKQGG